MPAIATTMKGSHEQILFEYFMGKYNFPIQFMFVDLVSALFFLLPHEMCSTGQLNTRQPNSKCEKTFIECNMWLWKLIYQLFLHEIRKLQWWVLLFDLWQHDYRGFFLSQTSILVLAVSVFGHFWETSSMSFCERFHPEIEIKPYRAVNFSQRACESPKSLSIDYVVAPAIHITFHANKCPMTLSLIFFANSNWIVIR